MPWTIQSVVCGDTFLGYVFKASSEGFSREFCADVQQKVKTREINAPGMPYVSDKSYDGIIKMAVDGYVSVTPDKGSRQCAALVKAALPALGPTTKWRKGQDLDDTNIQRLLPGTAIGYGFDMAGKYPSNKSGNHVAIFVSADDGDVKILDQYYKSETHKQPAMVHSTDLSLRNWAILTRVK